MELIDAAIAVIRREGKILVCQRKQDDTLGGFWEFPGGKQEVGETLEECLARELDEELAICVTPTHRLTTIEHRYTHAVVRLHPFLCDHLHGEPQLIECQDARWIEAVALCDYQFPPANDSLLAEVVTLCAALEAG